MLCIDVAHQGGNYPIYIGENLLNNSSLLPVKTGQKVMIVTNPTIAQHYLSFVTQSFQDRLCEVHSCLLPDGESHKNFSSLECLYNALIEAQCGRDCLLVALGGGVIGDICGLAAATYLRGVDFIQIPTTLLAQVDASVGGKTAINHPLGKNLIGAFYQPQGVFIDIHTLKTLPEREFSAGLAEVIKYGVALDNDFFLWLEKHMPSLLNQQTEALIYAIAHCCHLKKAIVERDEKEQGERALLNFGHTFGHAIESWGKFECYLHGEAVAMGMMLAAELSYAYHRFPKTQIQRLKQLLTLAKLPTDVPQRMQNEDFLRLMQRDKKVLDGKIRFILLSEMGKSQVVNNVPTALISQTIEACRTK